jgi:hypothetical protein
VTDSSELSGTEAVLPEPGSLEQQALAILEALTSGRTGLVLRQAPGVLSQLTGRPLLAAKVHAWVAQAHIRDGHPTPAIGHLDSAMALATNAGDAAGAQELQTLRDQAQSQVTSLVSARPKELPNTLLGRACAALDHGDLVTGEHLADEAWMLARRAGDPREQVLSLLALARLPHRCEIALHTAHTIADEADEPNLVSAVARAARLAGVALTVQVF